MYMYVFLFWILLYDPTLLITFLKDDAIVLCAPYFPTGYGFQKAQREKKYMIPHIIITIKNCYT